MSHESAHLHPMAGRAVKSAQMEFRLREALRAVPFEHLSQEVLIAQAVGEGAAHAVTSHRRAAERTREILREQEEVGRLATTLQMNLQAPPGICPAGAMLPECGESVQRHLGPITRALEEFHGAVRMQGVAESLFGIAARHQDWLDSLGLNEMRCLQEFAEQMRRSPPFHLATRLAVEAAILRYPFLAQDPREWPEGFGPKSSTDSPTSQFRGREQTWWRDMILVSGFLLSCFQAANRSNDKHLHDITIIKLEHRTPVHMEPEKGARIVEMIPEGCHVLRLDGAERFYPIWPSRSFKLGWILPEDPHD